MSQVLSVADDVLANPVLAQGQDPFVFAYGGQYYLLQSRHDRLIELRVAATLAGLATANPRILWRAPRFGRARSHIWAPELHYLDGRWYLYFAAAAGSNQTHRMYVVSSAGSDPSGPYGQHMAVEGMPDRWAIDATVLQLHDTRYLVWSGWPGVVDVQQNLYIAPMASPWRVSGPPVLIAAPDLHWEIPARGPAVNEGPAVLYNGAAPCIVFSANGSWTDEYCLGLLVYKGGDPCTREAWEKQPAPVFVSDHDARVFGPGHCSFVSSPCAQMTWMAYHAVPTPGAGWRGREVRLHCLEWDEHGMPIFGAPLAAGLPVRSAPVPVARVVA